MRIARAAGAAARILLSLAAVAAASQITLLTNDSPVAYSAEALPQPIAPAPMPAAEPSAAAEPALASPAGPAAAPAVLAAAPRLGVTHPLAIDRPMEHGDYVWNDKGVPAGPVWIVVDIEGQMLYAYRGGYEIGRAVILYGADDKPTPYGDFTVTQKRVDHVSNLYDAPMPYMMRLTDDGVAIHGSTVEYGSATHGCIGVPLEFAELLFAAARLGTPVAILDGWENEPGRALPRA